MLSIWPSEHLPITPTPKTPKPHSSGQRNVVLYVSTGAWMSAQNLNSQWAWEYNSDSLIYTEWLETGAQFPKRQKKEPQKDKRGLFLFYSQKVRSYAHGELSSKKSGHTLVDSRFRLTEYEKRAIPLFLTHNCYFT